VSRKRPIRGGRQRASKRRRRVPSCRMRVRVRRKCNGRDLEVAGEFRISLILRLLMILIVIVAVRLKVTRVLHLIMGLSWLLVLVLILIRIVGALGVVAICTPVAGNWNGRLVHLGHLGLMSISFMSHVCTRESQRVLSANNRPSILLLEPSAPMHE
jgi:hypothetical protein